jgi:dihydroorotase
MITVIKGGRVIDPYNKRDEICDVVVNGEKIEAVVSHWEAKVDRVIDATEKVVCPGFVDIHVHFRDPGFTQKEDLYSGSKAAAKGGFTTVCCMPNTNPVNDDPLVTYYITKKAKEIGLCDIFPIGAITKGEEGQEFVDFYTLKDAGCVAFSDDGAPVMNAFVLQQVLAYSKPLNVPITLHEEDINLSSGGVINEGYYSTKMGLSGISNCSESAIIARDVEVLRHTGGHIHVCHVSTKESIRIIERAKQDGLNITCEVTPHHLSLTEEETDAFNTQAKVNPPLRTEEDVKSLQEAVKDGIVDVLATDHAPHDEESKETTLSNAAFGISGLETAFAVLNTYLVEKKIVSLPELIALMTYKPSIVYHLSRGTLSKGDFANITVIDLNEKWVVNRKKFVSKGENTPFHNKNLKGQIYYTMYKGKITYERKDDF